MDTPTVKNLIEITEIMEREDGGLQISLDLHPDMVRVFVEIGLKNVLVHAARKSLGDSSDE